MAASLHGADVVGEGEHVFVVIVVILHGDLKRSGLLLLRVFPPGFDVNRLGVQHVLVAVDVLHERDDAALVAEGLLHGLLRPFVSDGDAHAAV